MCVHTGKGVGTVLLQAGGGLHTDWKGLGGIYEGGGVGGAGGIIWYVNWPDTTQAPNLGQPDFRKKVCQEAEQGWGNDEKNKWVGGRGRVACRPVRGRRASPSWGVKENWDYDTAKQLLIEGCTKFEVYFEIIV